MVFILVHFYMSWINFVCVHQHEPFCLFFSNIIRRRFHSATIIWPWNIKLLSWHAMAVCIYDTHLFCIHKQTRIYRERYEGWHMTLEFLLVPSSSHVCKIYYHWYRNTDWVGKVVTKIHKKIISGSIFIFCSAVCCSTEDRKHQIEFFSLTFFSFFLIFLYAFFFCFFLDEKIQEEDFPSSLLSIILCQSGRKIWRCVKIGKKMKAIW